mgnify:CR=1 FL=1
MCRENRVKQPLLPLVDVGVVGNAGSGTFISSPDRKRNIMRGLAYVIAAVAAVGIMIGIAMLPDSRDNQGASTAESATTVASNDEVMDEAGTLTLSVPNMHCEFACYPKIKEALESNEAVQGVELAEQKEEGVLDNRQVIVKYDAGFDLNSALASLAEKGYDEAAVVQ